MEFLKDIVAQSLAFFYAFTQDYGVSIILLTIVVRVITLPLSMKQMASTRAMQELAPERKKLEEKYKGDKEKLNKATADLYKEKNINPLGGCLPLLVQFPILIAIFGVLREPAIMEAVIGEGFNPFFAGLINLNEPDKLFILPVLAGLTTYIQTKQTSGDQPQQGGMGAMTIMMPVMILVFSIRLAAGLPLYWLVGNIFSIAQHYVVAQLAASKKGGAAE